MPRSPRARTVARHFGRAAIAALLASLLAANWIAPAAAEGSGSISGVVTNTQGEPLPNSTVRLFIPDGTDILRVVDRATTDEQGAYTFAGVTAGDWGIHVYGPTGTEYLGETWDNAES